MDIKMARNFRMYVNEDNNRKNILLNADWAAFFEVAHKICLTMFDCRQKNSF